jgi:uncharacterized protein
LIYFYGNAMCIAAAVEGGEFQEFRRRGFNVMVPDYLGYGSSGGKPSEAGVYATADACFEHLEQRGDVDPDKIVPLGLSLGGGAAFYLAAMRKEVPCVVTISAFTSVDAMARRMFPFMPTGAILKHHFDNETKIRTIRKPVFLAHGTRDGIIPFAMSNKLAAAAMAGGSKVVKHDVIDGDHNDVFDIGGTALFDAIASFIDDHATDPPPPPPPSPSPPR